jgi:hypothetical protein
MLPSAGLLDPSCPANAAATLTWLTANRPQHWRLLSRVLLLPVNNMLHAWSGNRRTDLPVALADLALPLLRVSQGLIEAVLQRKAARQMRLWRRQLMWHLQDSVPADVALAGNGSSSAAADAQIKDDVAALSDADVIAAMREKRMRTPGILLSLEDRQICCAALQCQEHVLEAGSTPTGLFKRQTQLLLSQLASSDEFAAAAVQLLVPCCHNWYCLEDNRKLEQQWAQEKAAAAAAAAAGSA